MNDMKQSSDMTENGNGDIKETLINTDTRTSIPTIFSLSDMISIITLHLQSFSHNVYIMRGIPGIGKSYLSTMIEQISQQIYHNNNDTISSCLTVSADHFFMNNGVYQYDGRLIGQAHAACLGNYMDAICKYTHHVVIVDNTNTTTWEYQNYIKLATYLKWQVYVLEYQITPQIIDLLSSRNAHGVSLQQCHAMFRRWEQHDQEMCIGYKIQPYVPPELLQQQEAKQQQQQQQQQHQQQPPYPDRQSSYQDTPRPQGGVWRATSSPSPPSYQQEQRWQSRQDDRYTERDRSRDDRYGRQDDRYSPYPNQSSRSGGGAGYQQYQPRNSSSNRYSPQPHQLRQQSQSQSSTYHTPHQSRFAGLDDESS